MYVEAKVRAGDEVIGRIIGWFCGKVTRGESLENTAVLGNFGFRGFVCGGGGGGEGGGGGGTEGGGDGKCHVKFEIHKCRRVVCIVDFFEFSVVLFGTSSSIQVLQGWGNILLRLVKLGMRGFVLTHISSRTVGRTSNHRLTGFDGPSHPDMDSCLEN